MKIVTIICGLCMLFFSCGCIIPCPHFTKTCGPICGYVLTEPNSPIAAKVEVSYPDGGVKQTKTDNSGHFAFSSKLRFHWGILFGVALNHSLPIAEYERTFSSITIEAQGYKQTVIYPARHQRDDSNATDNELYLDLENADCVKIFPLRE